MGARHRQYREENIIGVAIDVARTIAKRTEY